MNFFVSSLALTAVVAGVIYAATDEGWRHHQSGYYDQALGRAFAVMRGQAAVAAGLRISRRAARDRRPRPRRRTCC